MQIPDFNFDSSELMTNFNAEPVQHTLSQFQTNQAPANRGTRPTQQTFEPFSSFEPIFNKNDEVPVQHRSLAFILNPDFKPATPSSQTMATESEDDDEPYDFLAKFDELYGDEYSGVIENIPRWRLIYERTGRLDTKFKGVNRMEVKLSDVRLTRLKFTDKSKTRINVNEPSNKIFIDYQAKKSKKVSTITKSRPISVKTTSGQVNQAPVASNNPRPTEMSIKQKAMMSSLSKKLEAKVKESKTGAKEKLVPKDKVVIKTEPEEPKRSEDKKETKTKADETKKTKPNEMPKSNETNAQQQRDIRADLKRILSENREKRLKEDKGKVASAETPTKANAKAKESKTELKAQKRSFWEPDSDTEYGKMKKRLKRLNKSLDDEEEDEELDDDIVIVRKSTLNQPPVQYSKQFYDININGFESELKKMGNAIRDLNLKKSVTKSPIKSSKPQTPQPKRIR